MRLFAPTFIAEVKALLRQTPKLVVGVSGGPDSQALMHWLATHRAALGLTGLWAVGIDHGLRQEAGSELAVAAKCAEGLGLTFLQRRIRVPGTGNLLEQARLARYEALNQIVHEVGADAIVVAHTATDQIETVLQHLIAGAGLGGLCGMPRQRHNILRPFLTVARAEIETYLQMQRVAYAEDPSNRDRSRTRALLRHDVLPVLRRLQPQLEESLGRTLKNLQADADYLEVLAQNARQSCQGPFGSLVVDRCISLPAPLALRVLRNWLAEKGLHVGHDRLLALYAIVEDKKGTWSVDTHTFRVERGYLWLHKNELYRHELVHCQTYRVPRFEWMLTYIEGPAEQLQNSDAWHVAFDADHLHSKLVIRNVASGDRLTPWGMRGSIKVGDLFTNSKIPRALRGSWPVLESDNQILWVVGLRRGQAAPIVPTTRRVISFSVQGAFSWQG